MEPPALVALRERVRAESKLLVAFSGGADSALLVAVAAAELGDAALAVTAVSPSLAAAERSAARAFAREQRARHLEVCTDELDRPEYTRNDGDRCYHCKSALFDALEPIAALAGARIALGTNTDDLGDHRPGLRAAAARGAIAPLVDAGLSKADVRAASAALRLPTAAKPAAACLSSRVAYGEPVTAEVLAHVEAAEEVLRAQGFAGFRVRSHGGGTVARIEVAEADLPRLLEVRAAVEAGVRAAGFRFCAVDLAGFRSGRMNVLLGMPAPLGAPT